MVAAKKEFAEKVKNNELLVVGAVYDFVDDMKQGAGNLNIININSETDPAILRNMPTATGKSEHGHH